jgi:hypothetical protein
MSAAYLLHRVEKNKWICSMLIHWPNNSSQAKHKSLEIFKEGFAVEQSGYLSGKSGGYDRDW